MLPSLFLAHGSPMLAIENTEYTQFLQSLGKQIQPKAIVIFTAHWESDVMTISSVDGEYDTIYDFYGFPDELYQIKYRAKGSPELASRIQQLMSDQGIKTQTNDQRGLDHGSWTLLHRMYPEANIPVVQISVHPFLSPEVQFKIGEALRGLGNEDILIIGSGVTVHNLRRANFNATSIESWAVEFDDWLIDKVESKDYESLFNYRSIAPYAVDAVPRPEHFVPFFIALGSADENHEAKVIYRSYDFGNLSYLCYQF
ncbi:class III extradiol ring-cleavage dioxygenase [Paenibacillus sediminis]|uniref:4,5-DOPA dioxygenase extradiol n=1 Tax=Paenibacillus sediminis TaxID=664909 RepID=A0ABS4H1A6_9BACL|nr:class III extradiol ring-cleavage dioxygenase [Paenibacillus sediminis]MBP1936317.1 4,5-DOPA dioxygenase extradiol [Paenibacillus sediminis]